MLSATEPDHAESRTGTLADMLPQRDSRLWARDHTPLTMRWSREQLLPITERLEPLASCHRSALVMMIAASIARDIYLDALDGHAGVHYSRSRSWYQNRYLANGDPLHSYYLVLNGVDMLVQAGLVQAELGVWLPGSPGQGFQSCLWSTPKLVGLLADLVDPSEPRGLSLVSEIVILRDRHDRRNVDYTDTHEIRAVRERLATLNERLRDLEIRHQCQWAEIPPMRRIFNGSFGRGGRMYCNGASFQNMTKKDRAELEIIIDGEAHSMVEIDFSNLHVVMAYAEAGKRPPAGDLYAIEGFERPLVKLAVNVLFNASSTKEAVNAIAKDHPRDLARKVVRAIKRRHYRIKGYFGSDCGARFQRKDSDIAVEVMIRMLALTCRCPLPVHDSFIVADIDAAALDQVMREVAAEFGIPSISTSWTCTSTRSASAPSASPSIAPSTSPRRGTPSASPPIPIPCRGDTLPDQRRSTSYFGPRLDPQILINELERLRKQTRRRSRSSHFDFWLRECER